METGKMILKEKCEIPGAANWRLLIDGASDAAFNMAADEAMLTAHAKGRIPPSLRFYAWRPAAVSIGYFQSAEKELDLAACQSRGISVVRRLTGGRAVLHDAEVTYSLVVRENEAYLPLGVTASYLFFSQGIVEGLTRLGIKAKMQPPVLEDEHTKLRSAACFDSPSHYELTVGGRKVAGSAQVRRDGVLLQHGSILLDFSPHSMADILHFDDSKTKQALIQELFQRATSLTAVAGMTVGFTDVAEAVAEGISEKCGICLKRESRSSEEMNLLQELELKYRSAKWNLRR